MSTLKVGTIQDHANSITALTIDSSGRVNQPAKPAFRARSDPSSNTNAALQGTIIFNVEDFDIGGDYNVSNGRFTAPVAGIYHFSFDALVANDISNSALASGSSINVHFMKNGAEGNFSHRAYYRIDGASTYNTIYRSDIIQLAANDYVTVYVRSKFIYRDTSGTYDPVFQGHLVA